MSTSPHLSTDDVAAFVDGTLTGDDRAAAERHLGICDECRDEVTSCARLVAEAPSLSTRRIPWRRAMALAAVLLVAVVWRRPSGDDEIASSQERGAAGDGTRIVLLAPAPAAPLAAATPRFVWRPIDGSIGYHIVVKDASGTTVWSRDVADTLVDLPDGSPLRAGGSYVWRVDGQRADGTTASSVEESFRVAP